MIIKNQITEASNLSPLEKMQELDRGMYRNIKAMSDQKLHDNRHICLSNNLNNALQKIEAEMLARGLLGQHTSVSSNAQSSSGSAKKQNNLAFLDFAASDIDIGLLDKIIVDGLADYLTNVYEKDVSALDKDITTTEEQYTTYASRKSMANRLLGLLLMAATFNCANAAKYLLKKLLDNYFSQDNLSAILSKLKNNVDIVNKLDRLNETYGNNNLKESIGVDSIEKTTPYMLRNDGALIACGDVHPYIKSYYNESNEDAFNELKINTQALDWFINNSLNKTTIMLAQQMLDFVSSDNLNGAITILNELNDLTNQEFCRVRTSNFKYKYGGDNGEIYFRISSKDFNWFNIIWNIVYKFKNSIKFVTIMKDYAATGERFKYTEVDGQAINKMPVDEFIALNGNPIIENIKESFWLHRDDIVDEIKNEYHKKYNFDKYSDEQLYRMLRRLEAEQEAKAKKKSQALIAPVEEVKDIKVCDNCGTELTDSGECPVCDLGETEINEDIEKHDTLNPKLWTNNNELKPEVEEKILQITDEFLDYLIDDGIQIKIDDIILLGSNCSYNYTKDSDIDIHIIANTDDLECQDDLYSKLYSAYRTIFKKNIEIDFYGIPVEVFIETENSARVSNGVYSVKNHTWIKEPVVEDIPDIDYIDYNEFNKELKVWEDRYNNIINKVDITLTEDLALSKSIIADQIRGEWDAIKNYEKAIHDLEEIDTEKYKDATAILNDIASEEEVHVGELQKLQSELDDEVLDNVQKGEDEASEKTRFELEELEEELTPEEKVDRWADGSRIVNVKLCSEDKLRKYYDIAKKNGYQEICNTIIDTAEEKGILSDLVKQIRDEASAAPRAADMRAAAIREQNRPVNKLAKIAKTKLPKVVTNGMTDSEIDDWEDQLFNDLVSSSGNSETVAGEILSAWNYGCYRLLNDGDWWYGWGDTFNSNSARAKNFLKDWIALGRASEFATDERSFIAQGNKLILNKIFKESLHSLKCNRGWRDYPVK